MGFFMGLFQIYLLAFAVDVYASFSFFHLLSFQVIKNLVIALNLCCCLANARGSISNVYVDSCWVEAVWVKELGTTVDNVLPVGCHFALECLLAVQVYGDFAVKVYQFR